MRLILAAVAAAVVTWLAADLQSASAQPGGTRNPYCLRDGVSGPGSWDCSYRTMDQCRATASGAGGWCTSNPWYRGGKGRGKQQQPWGW